LITLKELLTSPCDNKEHLENLEELLVKLNHLRAAYGKPLRVTSGYRSLQKHLAIYAAKGITDQSKIPMQSRHLYGFAADLVPIEDDIKHLHDWVNQNVKLMEEIGLYMEAFEYTPQWLHCQSVPPKSGKRFFKP
jgi:uncharacterized protein YcbK (DUF882 family)